MAINFPQYQQQSTEFGNLTFPKDLLSVSLPDGKGSLYTRIQFVKYDVTQQINSYGTTAKSFKLPSGTSIKLPIPLKLNDTLIMNWSSISLTDTVAKFADQFTGGVVSSAIALGGIGGIATGMALNPLMFLQFQRPEYRQFSLSWTLAPKNLKESETVSKIIKKCKQAASPSKYAGNGMLMGYPEVAIIRMMPNDIFENLVFKPCVVTSVQVNYNAAPSPSFFKSGAPTVVTLTLNLMEMQFWFKDEIK